MLSIKVSDRSPAVGSLVHQLLTKHILSPFTWFTGISLVAHKRPAIASQFGLSANSKQISTTLLLNTDQHLIQSAMPDKMSFPLPVILHGTDITTLNIGSGENARTFAMHKELLCTASPFFDAALKSQFKESSKNTLTMADVCPMAFAVLYTYLYSGQVKGASFYTHDMIPDDLFWLRAL
jgi:hypothetical protein